MCGIGITLYLKLHMKIVVICVLMLKNIITYLCGHIRMLIAFLIIFLEFEFIVLSHLFDKPNHLTTLFHGVWFCLTVYKFRFLVLS